MTSLFFNKVTSLQSASLPKKEILARLFSCEFWKTFKNTEFVERLRTDVSAKYLACVLDESIVSESTELKVIIKLFCAKLSANSL